MIQRPSVEADRVIKDIYYNIHGKLPTLHQIVAIHRVLPPHFEDDMYNEMLRLHIVKTIREWK